jgi:peptidoglycan/xylan/chitin deacetylase (PgdA/CDA1 family)
MFHRVIPETNTKRVHNHLSLEITPEHFEQTINFFQKEKYDFISLDQLYDGFKRGILPKKKFVVITFDDGYKDNLEVAYPILKKFDIPFTVYITTGIPNENAILWWYILEDMIRDMDTIKFNWNGQKYIYNTRTIIEKEVAFELIQTFVHKHFAIDTCLELFSTLFKDFQSDLTKYASILGMNWAEIRKLNSDPLVTIGAHTVNHYPLSLIPFDYLISEIRDSKIELEKQLGKKIEHFAYPYGKISHASTREFECIKNLKFQTATTSNNGNLFKEHGERLDRLPRININRAMNGHVLKMQTSGLLPFIIHKGKKII